MDNAEEILQALEEFSKLKPKEIPKELEEYLGYVAKSGDPVYQWHLVKHLFHEKLLNVITEFYENSPTIDLPPCPNVDPFNYERMKTSLLERLDMFTSAPFTIQRICELLTNPRKQYNRVDKFMRAVEKNILVVSTREPGIGKRLESDQTEAVLNGIPDSKINESEDRIVNVCSDNLQYNNSNDASQVPVENAVNACIIQEQIEIVNSGSSTGESRSWCDSNTESDKKDIEISVKTDSVVDNPDISAVSTSSAASVSNSELPNSNLLFSDNEIKEDKLESAGQLSNDNLICTEPTVSSTPDSPDSPEPSSSEETCEPSTDDINLKSADDSEINISSENDNLLPSCDNISDVVEQEEEEKKLLNTENTDEIIESTSDGSITETSLVSEEMTGMTSEEVQQPDDGASKVTELKIEELSPENVQQPDSSNDSYHGGGENSSESDLNIQVGSVQQNEEIVSNNSETSSEQNISPELIDVTSSQASITIQEVEESGDGDAGESSNEELIDKEIVEEEDETVNSSKLEEIKGSVEVGENEENIVITAGEDAVASSDECVSIEEISEVKDVDESSNTQTGIVESSTEICEQDRIEGSIIHVNPSVAEAEQTNSTVEDICVDQSSCGASGELEEEAMEVDETSNQQMIMSEGEAEAEPMDQSEQLQS